VCRAWGDHVEMFTVASSHGIESGLTVSDVRILFDPRVDCHSFK
jgi:hypothetical protein